MRILSIRHGLNADHSSSTYEFWLSGISQGETLKVSKS